MVAGRSPRSAGARRVVARAGPLAALAVLGACVIPPRPLAPNPEALPATPPAVSVWSPADQLGSAFTALLFSTDRPAYATAFEVDRRGRVRVVFPRTPREDGRVEPGRTYTAVGTGIANDRMFLTPTTDWRRLPFLFVVVSDARPDLSEFGRGRSWQQQVRTDAIEAEDVIAAVADRVTAATGRPYATDFSYVAPRLAAREALFAASCTLPARDARDYWFFRDLWAVFTPMDPTFGITPMFAFGPVVTWASSPYIGVAFERAQWATGAFRGNCFGGFQPVWGYRSALFARLGSPVPGVFAGPPVPVAAAPGPRLTPPPGATPIEPRLPRTPREFADGPVRPAGAPGDAPTSTGERRASSWLADGVRRGGVTAEPLDRPASAEAMGRRWGAPGAWSTGAMVGEAGDRIDRRGYIRNGVVQTDDGTGDRGGSGWGGRAGVWAAAGGGVSGGGEPRTARLSPPTREPGEGGRIGGFGEGPRYVGGRTDGGRADGGRYEGGRSEGGRYDGGRAAPTPAPATTGTQIAPVAPSGGERGEGSRPVVP